jgi:hypothetical protein
MRTTIRILHITIIFTLLAVLTGCEGKQGSKTADHPAKGNLSELMNLMNIVPANEVKPAPEFKLPSVDGKVEGLSQYRGKVILLSFWATW